MKTATESEVMLLKAFKDSSLKAVIKYKCKMNLELTDLHAKMMKTLKMFDNEDQHLNINFRLLIYYFYFDNNFRKSCVFKYMN